MRQLAPWHPRASRALTSLALLLASAPAPAQVPHPYVDLPVPTLSEWLPVNALTTASGASDGRTYLYPNAALRDADTALDGTGSVAFIRWDLDDGSGRGPGLQVVTDDFGFPVQNCLMASGVNADFLVEGVPKTCSDDPGSSKRFFLEVTSADEPVDLVFSIGVRDLRYNGVMDPATDGGHDLEAFRSDYGVGRIYRAIQKFINHTGERVIGFTIELGTGVGDDFAPVSFEEDGVAFELRPLVPRAFFWGRTGAADREVWNEEFATFSPKLFDDGTRPRFEPGFFDHQTAGLFPPQGFESGDKTQYISTGTAVAATGHRGALTPNYFNMLGSQAVGSAIPPYLLGYMMPGRLAPRVIEQFNGGDPTAESDAIVAWWDGSTWRYGFDQAFAEVELVQLQEWAGLPVGLDIATVADPMRFGDTSSEDVSGINVDSYIYLGERIFEVDEDGDPVLDVYGRPQPRHQTITMRLVLHSVEGLGLGALDGSEEPPWMTPGSEAPPLSGYRLPTALPVAFNDFVTTMETQPVEIDVLANDEFHGSPVVPDDATITLVGHPSNGQAALIDRRFRYTADVGFTGTNRFTYEVTVDGQTSNLATVQVSVRPVPDPAAPVAANDSAATILIEPITIDLLANDRLDGQPIPVGASVAVHDEPLYGVVEINADQTATFTASEGFEGLDRFFYRVEVDGVASNVAMVILRVDGPFGPEEPGDTDDTDTPIDTDGTDTPVDPVDEETGCGCSTFAPTGQLGIVGLLSLVSVVRRRRGGRGGPTPR